MACNCGGKKNKAVSWTYTDANGTTVTYKSEVAAKAAQVRNGGKGAVRAVSR